MPLHTYIHTQKELHTCGQSNDNKIVCAVLCALCSVFSLPIRLSSRREHTERKKTKNKNVMTVSAFFPSFFPIQAMTKYIDWCFYAMTDSHIPTLDTRESTDWICFFFLYVSFIRFPYIYIFVCAADTQTRKIIMLIPFRFHTFHLQKQYRCKTPKLYCHRALVYVCQNLNDTIET